MSEQVQMIFSGQTAAQTRRVAAYCRVSTDLALQETSLETQMESFRQRIDQHPDWELVGIYADKGLTGTTAKGRIEFQRMMRDAENGKIDYILAKSISRFARNTVDALTYTRRLKELGVGVYFEEQSLDTLNAASEIFLTIHAAFAQEESHSFSENMKRGIRNRFAMGIPKWSETFGYRNVNDEWVIHEEEAATVREIFRLYIEGKPLSAIKKSLEERGMHSPKGERWHRFTISQILKNEKYVGDAEMQKSYTADCLTQKRVKNRKAEVPRYYIRDHHTPIVSREDFELAGHILRLRNSRVGSAQYPYYGYLKCPICGANMVHVLLPTSGRHSAWICKCSGIAVKERYVRDAIKDAFWKAFHLGDTPYAEHFPEEITYKMLYDLAEYITFKKERGIVDWHTLEVHWKDREPTTADIIYEKPSEIPCVAAEVRDGFLYVNGNQISRMAGAMSAINRIRKYIADVEIDWAEDVPVVTLPDSTRKRGADHENS